jgi:hypothetical protein
MLSVSVLSLSIASSAQVSVGVSVRIRPPALPVYVQPICPGPGYHWIPGYWAWDDDDGYYWVPGTWVEAPVGMLWTPGYWGYERGFYGWHPGYWGPHVGFYGGINYGFGYSGVGFSGGEWRGHNFYYNRSVMNVNVTNVTNVYNKPIIVHNHTRVAFNGGTGGIRTRPTPYEQRYIRESHTAPLSMQTQHEHDASRNHQLFASQNHGRPTVAATVKPGEFSGHNVVPARAAGEAYHAPKISPHEARAPSKVNGGPESKAGNHTTDSHNHAMGNGGMGTRPMGNAQHTPPPSNPKPAPRTNNEQIRNQPQPKVESRHETNNHVMGNGGMGTRPMGNAQHTPPPSNPKPAPKPNIQQKQNQPQPKVESRHETNNHVMGNGGMGTRPMGNAQHTPPPSNPKPAPKPNIQQKQNQPQPKAEPKPDTHEHKH